MGLRPGYKQTEVGVIPEEWDAVSIGEIAKFTSGAMIAVSALHSRSSDNPVPVFGGNGIAGYTSTALVDTPSVVVGRVGQKCGTVYLSDGPAWITDNALYPKRLYRSVETGFLGAALEAARLNDVKNRNDLPLVTQATVHAVRIPWPRDIAEQRAIAGALSDVDALLGALEKLIAKKRDLKQAAMQQFLTGKTRLPGFSGPWQVRRLEDVADVDPENLGSETRPDYRFKYISLEDVETGTLKRHSDLVFRGAPSRARRRLRNGDVLVSTVRPNLKSHLLFAAYDEDWICSTGFAVVRCRSGLAHPTYLFFSVFGDGISHQIDALLTGSNYPSINSRDVRTLELALPEYDEQAAIAVVLSDMDAEVAALEAQLAKTRLLKQGMMQELLTGRTRLPPVPVATDSVLS